MIDFVREPVTRIRVADLQAYATELLGKRWRFSHATGHRGEQSIEYVVTGLGGRLDSAIGVLNAACREGWIPPGLVIVDCHGPRPSWDRHQQKYQAQDIARDRRFASMAAPPARQAGLAEPA